MGGGGGGGGGGGREGVMRTLHYNFVVIALMIMKVGTGIKLDAFYTMVTNDDVITFTLIDAIHLNFRCSVLQNPSTDLA